jgi:hypothetical protein
MMRTHQRTVLAVISLAVLGGGALAACSGAPSASMSASTTLSHESVAAPAGKSTTGAAASRTAAGEVGATVTPNGPLVIRTGSVTLDVTSSRVVQIFNRVSSAADSLGGFVASSSSTAAGDSKGASLVVRVPSNDFGALVTRVDSFAKVESQSENGEDVTGESINLAARITNLKSEEGALRTLIARAGSIPSILAVQDQLFGVESDIEQLTAQQSSLIDQATYATLSVTLLPLAAHSARKAKPGENAVVHALKSAGHNTAVAARAIVLAIGWAFPIIVLAAIAFAIWRLRRRITGRHGPTPSTPSAPTAA